MKASPYFSGDDEYKKRLYGSDTDKNTPKKDANSTEKKGDDSAAKESDNSAEKKEHSWKKTFKTANDSRKFETSFFWQRGTYYWAFILASFTAHFACLGNFFSGEKISFDDIKKLPDFSLLSLVVTAFFCFFFSWSWVIVNKGSRFWQQNWENHIDALEKETIGHLFRIVMNEHNKENCSPNVFSCTPYRYSLAKATQMTGIVLMVASFVLMVFYLFIFAQKFFAPHWVAVVVVVLLIIVLFLFYLRHSVYSSQKKKGYGRDTAEWYEA